MKQASSTAAASDCVKLNKRIAKLKDQALEHLDDGVKVNYAKFQDVLEKIK